MYRFWAVHEELVGQSNDNSLQSLGSVPMRRVRDETVRQNDRSSKSTGLRSPTACAPRCFSQSPLVLAMNTKSQRPKRPDAIFSSLNAAIDAMNIAKDVLGMTPAKAAFGTVSVILTMIRVGFLLLVLVEHQIMCTGFYDQRSGLCRPRASLR